MINRVTVIYEIIKAFVDYLFCKNISIHIIGELLQYITVRIHNFLNLKIF